MITEVQGGSVTGVTTSVAAFVGHSTQGPADEAQQIWGWSQYETWFGGIDGSEMGYAVRGFFENGGGEAWVVRAAGPPAADGLALIGDPAAKTGLYALETVDLFNLLCLPDLRRLESSAHLAVATAAAAYCRSRRAFAILDLPAAITNVADAQAWANTGAPALGGENSSYAAAYWPEPLVPDPLEGNAPRQIAASGIMAGIYATTDRERGVWVAPAGVTASMAGVLDLAVRLTDAQNGLINPLGLNALRVFPTYGTVPWGARTLQGANSLGSEWKYVPVRRTALYIEESLARGLAWAAFEPNAEPLWRTVRLQAETFLTDLWRQGGLLGATPQDAYFVQCGSATTTMAEIEAGILNLVIGLALVKPAEFVILRIQLNTATADA
jgi:phage tail sheath protein FI